MFEPLESRKLFSTVTVAPVTVTEPTTGSTNATFTATLKSASTDDVIVTYATANKTAKAGSDYTATSGSVTVPAGSTSATFSVPVLADNVSETTETFVVRLKVSAGNKINATAVGTILDSTPVPTATVENTTVTEPAAKKRSTASVTVELSNPSSRTVTVYVSTSDATAVAGTNYVAAKKKLVFKPGQTTSTAKFTVIGTATTTEDTVFDVAVTKAVNATVNSADLFGTVAIIGADDGTFTDAVSIAPTSVTETGTGTTAMQFTVALSEAQSVPVTVDYATSDGTAVAGTDYVATTGLLTFVAGQTSKTIDVTVDGDAAAGSDETLLMTLSSPTNAVLGTSTAIGTILDGDTSDATPTLSVAPATVTASSTGTTTLAFPVTLSSAATSAVTVHYATADGTAVAGTDYVATSGTLTIATGATTGTVEVTVDAESGTAVATKTLTLSLSSASGATLATASATGTIDVGSASTTATPTLSVAAASATASSSTTTTMAFTVTLSSAAASVVTVGYATSNGTAVAGTDYTATSGTLTIAAGQTTGTVDVTVDAESATTATTKTLSLLLSSPSGATLGTATAIGTINVTATSTTSTDLSDNLSQTTDSTEVASGTSLLAASFTTGTSATTLSSVTIPLSVTSGGAVTVKIYTDGGFEPSSLVGSLTSPSSYSTTVTDTTFTGSVSLSAGTTYWVVVTATSGTANWAWTDSTTGSGTGFTGEWASSTNGGSTWLADDNYPLQMQVEVS